jgi:ribonuclease D
LITRTEALHRLANVLLHESVLAVDTESNSLHAYQEQVCLIQFSTRRHDFLVDPLSLDDLSPLGEVFAHPRIEKVFHAAEYDLICLKRDFSFEFINLFDTMLAARILGREAIGLGSMLECEFGVKVDKRYQRANWGKRPLPLHLLSYAQLDTHYLIALRERLHAELLNRGLWALAVEDFVRMAGVDGHLGEMRSEECWRISGSNELSPQNAAVLKELCRYRDQVARSMNRPLFKVIGDKTLLQIAEVCPDDANSLARIPGMTPGQIERHGKAILAAVERGKRGAPVFPPRNRRPGDEFLERLEALRNWRKNTALKMGVNSDVILPRDLLYTVAESNPSSAEDLAKVLKEVPWRMEHFGGQILDAVRNPQNQLA